MELSSSLLKEFAEETNDSEEITSKSTAYGTIVVSGARTYVQLDGSDQLTAISEGTEVQAGDRVIVTIENHVATVTTNLSVPATGRITQTMIDEGMIYGYFDVLEAQFATIGSLEATYIYAEEIDARLGSFEELAADFATIEYLEATFATIENLNASVANINELFADYAQIINADIQNLYAVTANIDDLTAKVAQIEEAYVTYEEVNTLIAESAGILYAYIETLNSDVANITNLLAGEVGVGDLQSIHLTADNAVIDTALITNALIGTVLADIITSNTIYTDQITIMSEDGGIYITGNQMQFSNGQIQFYDDNGVCRLQIGQDASGNFTFVLYDETGTGIMIDSEGIHESAVPDGLIVDSMVAEDANIAASKIDMADVISYINDSGDLVLDAYQIYIDGERLDYKLTEIEESSLQQVINYYAIGSSPHEPPCEPGDAVYDSICGLAICGLSYTGTIGWTTTRLYPENENEFVWFSQKLIYADGSVEWTEPTCLTDDYSNFESVKEVINYYAIGPSPYEPPYEPGDAVYDSICGLAICGLTRIGSVIGWTTTRLYAESDNEYVWYVQKIVYANGTVKWTKPTCLSDNVLRTEVSTLTTDLSVVQGQISAKIWMTDVEDVYYNLDDKITTINEQFGELTITIDNINERVGILTTASDYFYSNISEINIEIGSITARVSEAEVNLDDLYERYAEIAIELDSISLTVYDSENGFAFIQMTVGDNTSEVEVVTEARKAFAASDSNITIGAGTITFESGTLIVDSKNFSLDADGNAVFSGLIYAAAGGTIGGFTIGSDSLYTKNSTLGSGSDNVYVGNNGISLGTTFQVTSGGVLTATSGKIGGFTFGSDSLYTKNSTLGSGSDNVYVGNNGISLGTTFQVTSGGVLTATSGKIGGFTFGSDSLYTKNSTLGSGSDNVYVGNNGISLGTTFQVTSGGALTAKSGTVGGWTISSTKIYNNGGESNGTAVMQMPSSSITYVFAAGGSSHSSYADCPFKVTKAGALTAKDMTIGDSLYFATWNYVSGETGKTKVCTYDGNIGLIISENCEFINYCSFAEIVASTCDASSLYSYNFYCTNAIRVSESGGSYSNTSSASPNARFCDPSNGYSRLAVTTGSSIRYKNIVRNVTDSDISTLFNIPIVWFKYKDNYLSDEDERYEKEIPGFITENWEDVLPIAVDHKTDGSPEMWNSNIVIPLTFAMVKYNHELILNVEDSIDNLQLQIDDLKAENKALKEELAAIKAA